MDIPKLLEWGMTYFSEYISVFVSTIRHPTIRFKPIVKAEESTIIIESEKSARNTDLTLNPELFGFLIISIFIGMILNSIVPGRPAVADNITTVIVTLSGMACI